MKKKIYYPLLEDAFSKEDIELGIKVLKSKKLTMSKLTQNFEKRFAKYCGTKFCVGVGNGLDALKIILKSYKELGIINDFDEIIVPANTYIATILSILDCNLKPILIEPDIKNAYIWFVIAQALSVEGSDELLSQVKKDIETPDLLLFQTDATATFNEIAK